MNTYTISITSTAVNVSAVISPAQITFDPQLIGSLHGYSIAKLVYEFGDGTDSVTVYSSNSANACSVPVTHNYFRTHSTSASSITATLSAYEFATFACKQHHVVIGLNLPALDPYVLYPLEARSFSGRLFTVLQAVNTATNVSYVVANVISPASSLSPETSIDATSCVDPTPVANLTVTLAPTSLPIYGTSFAASAVSGVLTFVSDQGNYSSAYYNTIATAIVNASADASLFGGNNNYPYGAAGSIATNWSGYSTILSQQNGYPALGMRDLKSSNVLEMVFSLVLPSESNTWAYAISSNSQTWYLSSYNISSWDVGTTPIGFATGSFLATEISPTYPASAWCAEQLPITNLYARNSFSVSSSDLTGANLARIRYRARDGVAIYLNEQLIVTDNLTQPYTSGSEAICTGAGVGLVNWVTTYVPISCLHAGTNEIAAKAYKTLQGTDLYLDAEVATVSAAWICPPTTAGAPQLQRFGYLPGKRRYYDVVLPGDVHVFVLNSGTTTLYPCQRVVEPDGIEIGSRQYQWFVNAITNSRSRWKVVMFHVPFIGSTQYPAYWKQPSMDWGFESLGVHLVLNGNLGINEHCIRDSVHYVNCSATTDKIASVTDIDPLSVWTDVVLNNNDKGQPAIVTIAASPASMDVSFVRASTGSTIHSFKLV